MVHEKYDERSQLSTGEKAAIGAVGMVLAALAFDAYRHRRAPHRPADDSPRWVAQHQGWLERKAVTGKTILISKPKAELYTFWRDYKNLSRFMSNIESVETTGTISVWKISAPAGQTVTVETELVEDRENELLKWRSTEQSQIQTSGHISFRDAPADRGTYVEAVVTYHPPAGKLGRVVAQLLRREPHIQARHEMKRFKMLMETGEIATSDHYRKSV